MVIFCSLSSTMYDFLYQSYENIILNFISFNLYDYCCNSTLIDKSKMNEHIIYKTTKILIIVAVLNFYNWNEIV